MTPVLSPAERTARRASRHRLVRAAFGAALVILLTAAGVSFVGVRRFVAASRDMSRAHEVLRALDGVTDAPRGAGAAAHVADLRRLLAGDAAQEARLDAVARLAAGGDEKSLADAVREMRDDERERLEEASARLSVEARRLTFAASFARVIGAMVVALAFLAVRRYMGERERAEDALREARDAARRDAEVVRAAQEESRRAGERLQEVLDQVDSGVVLIAADGSVPLFNRAAERLLGVWRDQFETLLREGGPAFLSPDGRTPLPPESDPLSRALKGEVVRDARVFRRAPHRTDGCALTVSATPQRTPEGLTTGALLVFREAAPGGPGA